MAKIPVESEGEPREESLPAPVPPEEGDSVESSEERPATGEVSAQDSETEQLRARLAEVTEHWQRERANFLNYKRRVEEEKKSLQKYGAFNLALDLVRILDYFETSFSFSENLPEDARSVLLGVEYSIQEMTRVLASHGIKPLEVSAGQKYDPACMEAVERRVTSDSAAGSVVEVQRRGWSYLDRVLRPAQVVVAAEPEDNLPEKGGENASQTAADL